MRSGRPKKLNRDRRNKLFQVRLQESERKNIYAAASAKSLDASAWARSILLEESKQILEKADIK